MSDETTSHSETDSSADEAQPEGELSPLEAAQADAARFKDQALRALADLDNLRKRTVRELETARKNAKDDLIRELLPVFDNVVRGIQSAERAPDVKSLAEGLGMISRQFETTLEKNGIKRVPSIGAVFDPQVHEAIQQIETDEHAPGTIVDEVQGGYVHGDRLVRAALVVVAKPKASSSPPMA